MIVPEGSSSLDAWCANNDAAGQWITINKGVKIYGIVVQGKTTGKRIGYPTKVKAYKMNSMTPIPFDVGLEAETGLTKGDSR